MPTSQSLTPCLDTNYHKKQQQPLDEKNNRRIKEKTKNNKQELALSPD